MDIKSADIPLLPLLPVSYVYSIRYNTRFYVVLRAGVETRTSTELQPQPYLSFVLFFSFVFHFFLKQSLTKPSIIVSVYLRNI